MISQVGLTAANVKSSFSVGGFSSTLFQARDKVASIDYQISSLNDSYHRTFEEVNSILNQIASALTGIYAVLIAISAIAMAATILTIICSFYKCRLLLYSTCVIIFFIGIICFVVVTLISILLMLVYFGCDVTTYTLSSPSNFQSKIFLISDVVNSTLPLVPPEMISTINGMLGNYSISQLIWPAS